ncbi:transcription antitermination factor NusB [Fervidibacillus halotolerans]|uniref:Transcription antitermination protein NusB n=1 Tax=Fervidibacillus halotolerans TaxID=2980027 RepID=A0A9E8LXU3_9BACI|nr:transcription antitermination factor NusB [Fervidibacillus halotolerans]WAA11422.1 transcription antitermination factor NusB [Fervidibacillus halotolerans]
MKRRTAREKVLQGIFQVDVGNIEPNEAFLSIVKQGEDDGFLKTLFFGTIDHLTELDELIGNHLENWTLDRLGRVDRNLLRIATYEMVFEKDIPYSVSINEAVEIAKKYGDEESPKFINGVLSKIKNHLESE